MPQNSPLTNTPTPTLDDTWNIETFGGTVNNLEKSSVPKFATTSARNAAYASSAPVKGSLSYVQSLNHLGLQIYDGSAWRELGEYTRLRPQVARLVSSVQTNSTLYQNVPALSLPVVSGAVYFVDIFLGYRTEVGSTYQGNFVFPGVDSRISVGILGRGENASGGGKDGSTVNSEWSNNRASGDVADMIFDGTSLTNVLHARVSGVLLSEGTGSLTYQYRRQGSSGDGVITEEKTLLLVRRID